MLTERVLLFAPHPDDESIGAGGLLQRLVSSGAAVKVVYMTDGENNTWAHRALLKRWHLDAGDRNAYAALRQREALDALSAIGIDPLAASFIHLPDTGVAQRLRRDHNSLVGGLRSIIEPFDPTLIIGPSLDDLHPDHAATARLIAAAHSPRVPSLGYVVHGRTRRPPVAVMRLTASEQRNKRSAIAAHQSQLILGPDRLLRHASEYERFYDTIATRPIPLRTVKFWCSHLGYFRPVPTGYPRRRQDSKPP
jgi:LmbE family N-acetylglucosaminyl deacetylase